jgi:hypothetical protein
MSSAAIDSLPLSAPTPLYKSLFFQVVVALLLGIVLGMAVPDFAITLKILSDGFLKLIQIIVASIPQRSTPKRLATMPNTPKICRALAWAVLS